MQTNVPDKRIIGILHNLRQRELTPREWQQLETLAAGDPFLADALEGLKSVPVHEVQERLLSIEKQLQQKSGRQRVLPFWYRTAAAVVLVILVAASWLIWQNAGDRQNPALADLPEQPQYADDEQHAPPLSAIRTDTSPPTLRTPEPQRQSTPGEDDLALTTPSAGNEPSRPSPVQKLQAPSIDASEDNRNYPDTDASPGKEDIAHTTQRKSEPAAPTSRQRTLSDAATSAAPDLREEAYTVDGVAPLDSPRFITGAVRSSDGEPLIGANVMLKNSRTATVTDIDGNFNLALPQTADITHDSNRLVVSYTGYQTIETTVPPQDNLDIVLHTGDFALDEVLVTGYSKSARQDVTGQLGGGRAFARPQDGEKAYLRYIRKNAQYPKAAAEAGIHGPVTLEFTLDEEGTPQNFKVLQSLGYGCDEEAIRLIREGLKWDVASAQVPVGRYTIEF